MGAEQSVDMNELIFNLRMTNKQLTRMSDKALKESEKQKAKVKKYLEQNHVEAARVYAENAIRKKNESVNLLRMASRIDATVSRLQSSQQMKQVAHQMGSVVKGLDKAMASMNLEQIAAVMDKFESQFTELDVRSGVMENAMTTATGSLMPEDEIEGLMSQVAEENHLEVMSELNKAGVASHQPEAEGAETRDLSKAEDEDLSRRLAALRS